MEYNGIKKGKKGKKEKKGEGRAGEEENNKINENGCQCGARIKKSYKIKMCIGYWVIGTEESVSLVRTGFCCRTFCLFGIGRCSLSPFFVTVFSVKAQ